ncbi:MAG: SGNH/GDSL hydrolase family protein [Puniceicoccaceae bacterium]
MGGKIGTGRKVFFISLIVLVELLICLVGAELFLSWRQDRINNSNRLDPGLIQYDRVLGWKLAPGWKGTHGHHDFEVTYTINEHGFRGDFPDLSQPKERPRIGVLGDSFTFGFGVDDGQTFVDLLQQENPDRDWLNLAVPGYSTDQEYLLMRNRGRQLAIDHYLLVIYLGNDFLDNALPYPLQTQLAKPYFELTEYGDLLLRNSPVPREPKPEEYQRTLASETFGDELVEHRNGWLGKLKERHLFSRIFQSRADVDKSVTDEILKRRLTDRIQLMEALVEAIQAEAASRGTGLSVILLPGQSLVSDPDSYSGRFQAFVGEQLMKMCQDRDLACLDVAWEFGPESDSPMDGNSLFHPNEGHFTEEGHKAVKNLVLDSFEEWGLRDDKL